MKTRNILFAIIITILTTTGIFSQNTNPVVDNVSFTYDGSHITATYYLSDANQTSVTVRVFISEDSGVSWSDQTDNASADVGTVACTSSPAEKTIYLPYTGSVSTLKVKVLADDETADGSPCSGVATVDYGGKTYHTIQIGDQCWLKENLDVGTMIDSVTNQTDNGTIEKYCYYDDPTYCATYGGLYQWDEAMQYSTTEGSQGICPSGWHIPTYSEMQTLQSYVGNQATKLIDENAKNGYTFTNTSGFTGLLAGGRYYLDGSYANLTNYDFFWSSLEASSTFAYYIYWAYDISSAGLTSYYKTDGFSVRCIKD